MGVERIGLWSRWGKWVLALVAVIVSASGFGAGPRAWADDPPTGSTSDLSASGDVAIAVIPGTTVLAAGDATLVRVVLSNTTTGPAVIRSVALLAPPRVTVTAKEPASVFTIEPGQRQVRTFDVVGRRGMPAGKLVAVADISAPPPSSAATVDRYVTASAELVAQDAKPELSVSIKSAPTDLEDGQSNATMTVLIANPTNYPLRDIRLRSIESMDISLRRLSGRHCGAADGRSLGCVGVIEPGGARAVVVGVEVQTTVRSGTQKVGIIATGTLQTPTAAIRVSGSDTTEVSLEVFGVSAVAPFGSTAQFLMPAIVAFVVFLGCNRLIYPRSSWLPSKVDVGNLTWVVVLLPLATLAYLIIWFCAGVDLTKETSTFWVLVLFVIGLSVGFGSWGVFAVGHYRRIGRRQFKPGDSIETVLERMDLNESALSLPFVAGSSELVVGQGPGDTVAVTSPAIYAFADSVAPDKQQEFITAIDENDPGAVLRLREQLGPDLMVSSAGAGVRLVAPGSVTTEGVAPYLSTDVAL